MIIKINSKCDPRVSQNFPNDPYSNLCILTTTQKLNLQQAFLSMDSQYFSKIDPDTRQIDLRELKEEPLIKVVHSLYGEELVANSISELVQIYPIIVYLGIEDYKKNIEEEVNQRRDILENIEFLEMSFKYGLCWAKVVQTHLQSKLRMLQDSKSYLQLSKIGNQTFNLLLLQFIKRYGQAENKVINNVMENYFNRKSVKPMVYLKNPSLQQLQVIWLKYHHVPISELTPRSSPIIAPTLSSTTNVFSSEETRSRKFTEALPTKTISQDQALDGKRRRVMELQKEISSKDTIIFQLNCQIEQIKKQIGVKLEVKPPTARSLLIEVEGQRERVGKKSKRLQDLLGDGHSQHESIIHEQGKQGQEFKPLHRLGSKNVKKS